MSDEKQPVRRREAFDSVPEFYDSYRPDCPQAVVDGVIAASHLAPGSRVLEIGCGTGQLSRFLAEYGVDLIAVELGPHLAALARRNLDPFPNAQVEIAAFEDWTLPEERFDAVVAASAFHWLEPEVRVPKSAKALRPGGFLTLVHAHHVRGGTPGFFADTQKYYLKWGLSDDPFFEPTAPADVPAMFLELDESPQFDSVQRHRFEVPRSFSTAASYVGWLNTDSLILGLDDFARAGFLKDIEALVESKYHGAVSRNWVYEVVSARRK
ncbi:MAG TPA: class I SAM-dependent methyltransferase [Acidimicrobiales bacterium]|nr:class I SAM-dependent methyltransferase [Acidimicrobiales bacterium]